MAKTLLVSCCYNISTSSSDGDRLIYFTCAQVEIQGAEEAALAAAPPMDNINVLGVMPTPPGSRCWRWCVKVHGNRASVWAEQDPMW